MKQFGYIIFFLAFSLSVTAQYTRDSIKYSSPLNSNSLNKAASKLSRSLNDDQESMKVAENYENLAKELFNKTEYSKAEEYLKKAKTIYINNNNQDKVAKINRELAKIQEAQKDYKEAIKNYEEAGKISTDNTLKQVNQNDAERLRNNSNPVSQSNYIRENIQLLEKTTGENDDKAAAYKQMAETQIQLNQNEAAIQNYEKALDNVIKKERATFQLKRDMANVYFANMQSEKGIQTLQEAYQEALDNRQTFEAKKSLELLADEYLKKGESQKTIDLYHNFLTNLESLIRSDSSLVDIKLFQITEERINQLEKERALKDELILKKNSLNNVLIVSILLMLILLLIIFIAFRSVKNRNKKIALQSLRREMNPHFIFNSLNSVNQFIVQNNELEANKYLTSYSRLMRNIMENSNKDFIKLNNEIEQLKEYLDLEYLRFSDKFEYSIQIDENIDTESISIPNMLIQPHLENAIWHGLRYKEGKGFLHLNFILQNNHLLIKIEDNGIGLVRSQQIKTENQKIKKSRGLKNVEERIKLLNELYKLKIISEIMDKKTPDSGVIVNITIPLGIKN